MHTRIILLGILILGFIGFIPKKEKKYLPVVINFVDSTLYKKEISMQLWAAFAQRRIKCINANEAKEEMDAEVKRVINDYFSQTGKVDFESQKKFMEQNMRYVYNNLDLSVYIDSSGYLEKQIGWRNNPLPINFNLFKKPVWKTCLLDSTQTITMASMANAIADSIVASNVLLKED